MLRSVVGHESALWATYMFLPGQRSRIQYDGLIAQMLFPILDNSMVSIKPGQLNCENGGCFAVFILFQNETEQGGNMGNFFKTTFIGGLIFLIPIVVLVVVLKKAYSIMMVVAVPLDKLIPIEAIGGVALVNILAVLCIFVACFISGFVAKSKLGKVTFDMIDTKLVLFFPGYS